MRKFENVGVVEALSAVVDKNTLSYKTDFNYDKELFIKAAESLNPEDKNLLWLSRHSGTECFAERDVFIRNISAFTSWTYYEGHNDELVAFAVEITSMENGRPVGNLYELNHEQHSKEAKHDAVPPENVLLTFKDGEQKLFPYVEYKKIFQGIRNEHGRIYDRHYEVKDEQALQSVLKRARDVRSRFPSRSIDAFIKSLPQQERPSITEKLNEAKKAVKPPASEKKSPVKVGPKL